MGVSLICLLLWLLLWPPVAAAITIVRSARLDTRPGVLDRGHTYVYAFGAVTFLALHILTYV